MRSFEEYCEDQEQLEPTVEPVPVAPPGPTIKTFQIIDRHTKLPVGKPYSNRIRAMNRRDKLDNEYGAYRYSIKTIYPDGTAMFS